MFRRLLKHAVRLPVSLALDNAGSNRPARMAIMAITTNNSIKVNARPAKVDDARGEDGRGCFIAGFWRESLLLALRAVTRKIRTAPILPTNRQCAHEQLVTVESGKTATVQ